jgi:hypothetical protein
MTPERSKLYHCSQQIAQALVETTTNERERRALYRSLEWLGVAEIRAMNAEVSTDRLTSSGADLIKLVCSTPTKLSLTRKIAGKLGIAQKVNGKDAPLAWLRAQIKNRLSEKPIETAPIILQVMTVA